MQTGKKTFLEQLQKRITFNPHAAALSLDSSAVLKYVTWSYKKLFEMGLKLLIGSASTAITKFNKLSRTEENRTKQNRTEKNGIEIQIMLPGSNAIHVFKKANVISKQVCSCTMLLFHYFESSKSSTIKNKKQFQWTKVPPMNKPPIHPRNNSLQVRNALVNLFVECHQSGCWHLRLMAPAGPPQATINLHMVNHYHIIRTWPLDCGHPEQWWNG